MIRVALPTHLRRLAGVEGELHVEVHGPVTLAAVLDAVEAAHPVLRGTTRDHGSLKRRDLVRFFACGEDLSNEPMQTTLPQAVSSGAEPLLIVGAIAGG